MNPRFSISPRLCLLLAVGVLVPGRTQAAEAPIDYAAPVLNLAHNPDAREPVNPRNILTKSHDQKWLAAHLLPGTGGIPYPTIETRAPWENLQPAIRQEAIAAAEQVKDKSWEPLTATLALNYWRNGNRSEYSSRASERQGRLQKLVLAEAIEAKGRFLDPIADAVWLISEETYWGEPAHIPQMQRSGPGLPNVEEPTVELFAAERGAALAWTHYLLGARLDTVSPLLRPRIVHEIDRRVLTPFLARDDFWWMGLAERKDLNNWTPWIVSNVLTCALLVETDPARRVAIVEKCLHIMDRYLNLGLADGGCDEGPGYWLAACGSTFDFLEQLRAATGGELTVYDDPLIRKMAHFICDAHVAGDWTLNFGDGSARSHPQASLVYRFGRRVDDPVMTAFGAWLAGRESTRDVFASNLNRQLPAMFGRAEIAAAPAAEPLPRDVYLPDLQMITARDQAGSTAGLYFGIRGYYNAKSHNHNDAGSFMLYADGQPLLIDVGTEVYTAKSFSPQRYDIWTMQSAYHNLPTINGRMQGWGRRYEAAVLDYQTDDAHATVEMELAKAYPAEAAVESWRRRLELIRGEKIVLTESYRLKSVQAPLVLNFMTAGQVDASVPGRLILTSPVRTGERPVAAVMTYDAKLLAVRVEEIATSDHNLEPVWGRIIRRIQFIGQTPMAAGQLVFEFKKR